MRLKVDFEYELLDRVKILDVGTVGEVIGWQFVAENGIHYCVLTADGKADWVPEELCEPVKTKHSDFDNVTSLFPEPGFDIQLEV